VRKCPYCDFNSHPLRAPLPEQRFVDALLADLGQEAVLTRGRALSSIFLGGGTPSLLSGKALAQLLQGIRKRIPWEPDIEITLEANPGTAEVGRFAAFRESGVDRLSVGIQSFDSAQLAALGRIHGPDEALSAITMARSAGFDNLNLDLMFGLPRQDLAAAGVDLATAVALQPDHISYYQLTLEPNTRFFRTSPPLPDEDLVWEIQQQGQTLLSTAGYARYEVSAYARPGRRCRHNLNYWCFGDYLGIGPGAHGKINAADGRVWRRWKFRSPDRYLTASATGDFLAGQRLLSSDDLMEEFLMNALRLEQGFSLALFEQRTGLELTQLLPRLQRARSQGLLRPELDPVTPTARGYAFLNDLLVQLSETL
jgi:putative oxygen-independent coproporphyrinogen III oxidase